MSEAVPALQTAPTVCGGARVWQTEFLKSGIGRPSAVDQFSQRLSESKLLSAAVAASIAFLVLGVTRPPLVQQDSTDPFERPRFCQRKALFWSIAAAVIVLMLPYIWDA